MTGGLRKNKHAGERECVCEDHHRQRRTIEDVELSIVVTCVCFCLCVREALL
jgi:hypothetical protein